MPCMIPTKDSKVVTISLTVYVVYVTMGTGYVPIQLIQLRQCSDAYFPEVCVISALPQLMAKCQTKCPYKCGQLIRHRAE
jgi:hypothetical protein